MTNIFIVCRTRNEKIVHRHWGMGGAKQQKHKHYNVAGNANREFLDGGYNYVTTNFIMNETFTLLRHDVGHKRAVEFGNEINQLRRQAKIDVIMIDWELMAVVWQIFES